MTRSTKLYLVLCGFFITNALFAQFIGVKIFALEPSMGLEPIGWSLFGVSGTLQFTTGVLLWPVVFVLTDVMNEFYGPRGVRFISWLTVGLILYASAFAFLAIDLTPADWWVTDSPDPKVPDQQAAFAAIFGQGLWTIAGSVTAFLVAQLIDVAVFQRLRRWTGGRWLGLRATGSTLISQFFDSFIVLYIAFVIGPQQWPTAQWLAIGSVNYAYKLLVAIAMTPVIYLAYRLIRRYLAADRDYVSPHAA